MPKVVRRIGHHPDDHLVVLGTDSTTSSALLVSAEAYVPGKEVGDYDLIQELFQLDMTELEEVEPHRMLWAVFADDHSGELSRRVSDWMTGYMARSTLTVLRENGEQDLYLVAEDGQRDNLC